MSYNGKKFLDINGLKHLISILDDYPTNEVLGTVINAIESEIPTNVSQLQNDAGYLTAHQDISGKANSTDLAAVATSGDYDDLINKPTIPAVPVQDVQINGTSVITNGVANVPVASYNNFGIVKTNSAYGTAMQDGFVQVYCGLDADIKTGTSIYKPVSPARQHQAAFYGLAKAAGDTTQAVSANTVGNYTDNAKQSIQRMLGITDLLSTEETTTATAAHTLNSLFLMDGKLHKATAAIAIGDAVVEGTNCEVVKVEDVFVKNTDIATSSTPGLVRFANNATYGIWHKNAPEEDVLRIVSADGSQIKAGTSEYLPITPVRQHSAVFYGLSKLAGVNLANETVTVGTYPETSKTAIRSLIGAAAASDIPSVPVQDVQVAGTSVLSNGVADVPIATASDVGVIKPGDTMTVYASGALNFRAVGASEVKNGTVYNRALTPERQHASTFYGLAKAAGADEKDSTLPIGTYTETAKTAIRNMLGAASTNIVAVQDEQPTDTDTKVWLSGTQATGVQVPTMEDLESGYVKKTDIATSTDAGIVKVSSNLGVCFYQSTNYLGIQPATTQYIKDGTTSLYPIAPNTAHSVAFYGLAKAAGDTTQAASDNAVGTYTDGAKTAIRSMLGAIGDVQVDSTSVVSNGIANIPRANPSSGAPGVVGIINYEAGLKIADNGHLSVVTADATDIKTGTNLYRTLTPGRQYASTFYGLAKAAGDTTQSASSNTVGTYTAEAKAAIQSMLGIDLQSIASEVEIPLVETISGTTPTITGQPNTRYVCGEVSTLSITPPSAGSIDVIFDSGSTPTVITVPNTVRWPVWFDATALEADTTYEILITDGVYGSVMTWAN